MAIKKANKKAKQEDKKSTAPKKDAKAKKAVKASAKAKKSSKASKKNANPGLFGRIKAYFVSVKTEMHRVTWPSKQELVNYSVAVCVSLIVVGIVIAALDMGISEALALFSGLRG